MERALYFSTWGRLQWIYRNHLADLCFVSDDSVFLYFSSEESVLPNVATWLPTGLPPCQLLVSSVTNQPAHHPIDTPHVLPGWHRLCIFCGFGWKPYRIWAKPPHSKRIFFLLQSHSLSAHGSMFLHGKPLVEVKNILTDLSWHFLKKRLLRGKDKKNAEM